MASRIQNTFVITPTGTSLTLPMIHLIIRLRDSLAAWEIPALNCGLDKRYFPYDSFDSHNTPGRMTLYPDEMVLRFVC